MLTVGLSIGATLPWVSSHSEPDRQKRSPCQAPSLAKCNQESYNSQSWTHSFDLQPLRSWTRRTSTCNSKPCSSCASSSSSANYCLVHRLPRSIPRHLQLNGGHYNYRYGFEAQTRQRSGDRADSSEDDDYDDCLAHHLSLSTRVDLN